MIGMTVKIYYDTVDFSTRPVFVMSRKIMQINARVLKYTKIKPISKWRPCLAFYLLHNFISICFMPINIIIHVLLKLKFNLMPRLFNFNDNFK